MMGDYIFNPLVNYRDDPLEIAFEFGKLLGFTGNCTAKLLQFLKALPVLSMVTKMPALVLFIEKVDAPYFHLTFSHLFSV